MKKIVIHRAGGYDRLRLETHPTPRPGPGQVLVRTQAAGVNYADSVVRWGLYESARRFVGWPITPGFEFSGHVEAIGSGVDKVSVDDAVFGVSFFGAYSTHVVVPQHQLFPLPARLSAIDAAAFPAVFLTAYHALFQNVIVPAGGTLMVHSAAGGVGTAAVQLAKIHGHTVVGVVGASHKVELVRSLGADHVIDKSRADLWREAERIAPDGYDLILDGNGVSTLAQSYRHLRKTGKLMSYGHHSMLPRNGGRINYLKLAWNYLRVPRFNPIHMASENRSLVTFNLSFLFDRQELLHGAMTEMLQWLERGKLVAPVVTTFPLKDVADAHRAIESGQTTGKLVLLTADA